MCHTKDDCYVTDHLIQNKILFHLKKIQVHFNHTFFVAFW